MAREPILYVFVDNSNVLIEGRRFAEMKRKAKAKLSPYVDDSYEIDWGKFLYVLGEKDKRGLAVRGASSVSHQDWQGARRIKA